jgi:nucleotide-binding universal stress UspA family protein
MTQTGRRAAVVVGVDGSESALRAARWAADEARRRGAPLRVVTAFAWARDHVVGHPGLGEQQRDVMLERTRRQVAAAADEARRAVPDLEVEADVVTGFPIGVLADEARTAGLVVVGDRGLTRIEGLLLGSVAVALAAHGAGPVVVVRGTEPPAGADTRPVLVGVDGAPTSEAALEFAVEFALARGVPLVAVRTWSDWFLDAAQVIPADRALIDEEEGRLLTAQLEPWQAKHSELPIESIVEPGSPARALLRQAERAQLVVVGSRGHAELMGLVLGSVGNALVHRAPCPVAVVRHHPPGEQPEV